MSMILMSRASVNLTLSLVCVSQLNYLPSTAVIYNHLLVLTDQSQAFSPSLD